MKQIASAFTLFYSHIVFYFKHFSVGAFGVGEYMQLREIKRPNELYTFFEKFVRFAPYAHYGIHADKSIGQILSDNGHFIGKIFGGITSFHQFENLVAATLERNVKMRHYPLAYRYKPDDFFGEQIRFHRRNPETYFGIDFIEGF